MAKQKQYYTTPQQLLRLNKDELVMRIIEAERIITAMNNNEAEHGAENAYESDTYLEKYHGRKNNDNDKAGSNTGNA